MLNINKHYSALYGCGSRLSLIFYYCHIDGFAVVYASLLFITEQFDILQDLNEVDSGGHLHS